MQDMKDVIYPIILILGAWNKSGQQDDVLEKQFKTAFDQLKKTFNTDHEGAINILLSWKNESGEQRGSRIAG